jgi:hypothetical protein
VTNNEREAQRRVNKACSLIRSAYRLADLDPAETLLSVRTAIVWGAEQAAVDVADAVAASR